MTSLFPPGAGGEPKGPVREPLHPDEKSGSRYAPRPPSERGPEPESRRGVGLFRLAGWGWGITIALVLFIGAIVLVGYLRDDPGRNPAPAGYATAVCAAVEELSEGTRALESGVEADDAPATRISAAIQVEGHVHVANVALTGLPRWEPGRALDEVIGSQLKRAGLIAIPLTILILLFVVGSLTGALVPVGLALTAVLATMGLVSLPSQIVPMNQQINEVILLVGLAVGVDYALFYMRRERDERRAGRSEGAALAAAAATSGRAVLISGFTVMIAMAGMFFSGDKTFVSFAVGTMLVVLVAMIGSLTVLPAILSVLGDRVEKGRIPFLRRRRSAEEGRFWGAILRPVLRHPVIAAVASAAVLVVLALPALQLHTAEAGLDALPKDQPELQTFHAVEDAFPGGASGATVAVTSGDPDAIAAAIPGFETAALATGELLNPIDVERSPDGSTFRIDVPLAGEGTDEVSDHALATLRDEVLPATFGTVSGAEYAVTGGTAASHDFTQMMKDSVPLVFGFVLLFAFLLLLFAFRSIIVALKAIVLNLLSVAAAYGILVAVFQWGWGENLLDFNATGGIVPWLPVFLFVILFGLSMDYHVFILSRIREAYDRGMSTRDAVEHGIRSTAGVVTGAAIVMVGVFSVFALLPILDMKQMGIGLAAAILIDATIVRAVLLPATMTLLGDRNWYLPSWLAWLPRPPAEDAPEQVPAVARCGAAVAPAPRLRGRVAAAAAPLMLCRGSPREYE